MYYIVSVQLAVTDLYVALRVLGGDFQKLMTMCIVTAL